MKKNVHNDVLLEEIDVFDEEVTCDRHLHGMVENGSFVETTVARRRVSVEGGYADSWVVVEVCEREEERERP